MTQVFIVMNPFEPMRGFERLEVEDGITPREWLHERFGPDFVEFDRPTVLKLNGEFVMRKEWETRRFVQGDVATFISLPGGLGTMAIVAIVAVVISVISVGISLYMMRTATDPSLPDDQTQSPNAVYNLRGQTNQFRPGEPIEVAYGRVRHWPTYACYPYSEYIGNQQYQYSLFCLGQGEFDIHAIQFEDTPVSDFPEVTIEVVPPGGSVTLVESAVFTSTEVSNIELLAPNEDGYLGMAGPYVINDWEHPIHRISIDLSFPQGLYKLNEEGKLKSQSVNVVFYYQSIDADGNALGGWVPFVSTSISRKDNTPQRVTFSANVSEGRYKVQGGRFSSKPDSTGVQSQCRWEAAKGYSQNVGSFGNVTMIAMKALATNSLNNQTVKAFNVVMTRKIPAWSPAGGWTGNTATRNPVWAFCDIFRSLYGAKLTDEFLDLPTLYNIAQTFETRNDWFDWIYDSSLSVWEAAKMPLAVGHTMPIPQGSLITAVRDEPQTLPSGVFNQHNIVEGSLKKIITMYEFQPFDGLTIEYTDQLTWKPKEVNCVLPGRSGLNLDRLKIPGCTDRDRAYREGMYIQSKRELQRKTVTFQTGLEGHIPSYMDLISITHDTVRVGQGGMIVDYDAGTREMTLSEQVNFATDNINHVIAIRGDDGAIMGAPISVVPGSSPNKVILASDPIAELDFSSDRVPPLYAFGVAEVWAFLGKVAGIKPIDEGTVEITALNYAPAVYNWSDSTTIPAQDRPVIRNVTNPRVEWVSIIPVPDKADRAYIDWKPVASAVSYVVQVSYDYGDVDGTNWNQVGNFVSAPVEIGTNAGVIVARVAPFALNGNVIYTESAPLTVGSNVTPPIAPDGTNDGEAFYSLTATARWGAVNGALGYIANVYCEGVLKRTFNVGTSLRADYSFDDYTADAGTGRAIQFKIAAFNDGGAGNEVSITLTNPLPVTAPSSLAVGTPTGTNYPATWAYTPIEGDELEFRVYASTTAGFTPGPSNLVASGVAFSATVPAPVRPLYWRVAVIDKWGPELKLSAEATIPA